MTEELATLLAQLDRGEDADASAVGQLIAQTPDVGVDEAILAASEVLAPVLEHLTVEPPHGVDTAITAAAAAQVELHTSPQVELRSAASRPPKAPSIGASVPPRRWLPRVAAIASVAASVTFAAVLVFSTSFEDVPPAEPMLAPPAKRLPLPVEQPTPRPEPDPAPETVADPTPRPTVQPVRGPPPPPAGADSIVRPPPVDSVPTPKTRGQPKRSAKKKARAPDPRPEPPSEPESEPPQAKSAAPVSAAKPSPAGPSARPQVDQDATLRACRSHAAAGDLVSLSVAFERGRVMDASVRKKTGASAALVRCLTDRIERTWRFKGQPDGRATYSFSFDF